LQPYPSLHDTLPKFDDLSRRIWEGRVGPIIYIFSPRRNSIPLQRVGRLQRSIRISPVFLQNATENTHRRQMPHRLGNKKPHCGCTPKGCVSIAGGCASSIDLFRALRPHAGLCRPVRRPPAPRLPHTARADNACKSPLPAYRDDNNSSYVTLSLRGAARVLVGAHHRL